MADTPGIKIRMLYPGDSLAELTAVLHRAFRPLAEQGMRYLAGWQDEEVTRKRAARGECYVALDRERIVGTITFHDTKSTTGCAYYEKEGVASLHQLAVDPDYQGRGIGAALLDVVERRARETGAAEIALDTAETNERLIAMYAERGYRIVDSTQWQVTNYRSVVMTRSCREAARYPTARRRQR